MAGPSPRTVDAGAGRSHRASALEIASGIVVGRSDRPPGPALPSAAGGRPGAALSALEAAVLPALLRQPCVVSFSGGTDSSLVLAVATRVARRHGLPDPVPFTWRIPTAPASEESEWQHRVVEALRLREWAVRVADRAELDFVGPQAQEVLSRHGVLLPANAHLLAAPVELARGGSVLTGVGGDQILSGWRRPEHLTLLRRAKDHVPAALRVAVRRLPSRELPWLRPRPAARLARRRMEEEAAEPVRLADRLRWHAGRRELELSLDSLHRLGRAADAEVVSPIVDPRFVHALARELGDGPAPRRSALVASIAGDAAPAVVWASRRKARFGDVFLSDHSRELAGRWDGQGTDATLVDAVALRHVWSGRAIPLATAGLLQQVFLAGTTARTARLHDDEKEQR